MSNFVRGDVRLIADREPRTPPPLLGKGLHVCPAPPVKPRCMSGTSFSDVQTYPLSSPTPGRRGKGRQSKDMAAQSSPIALDPRLWAPELRRMYRNLVPPLRYVVTRVLLHILRLSTSVCYFKGRGEHSEPTGENIEPWMQTKVSR